MTSVFISHHTKLSFIKYGPPIQNHLLPVSLSHVIYSSARTSLLRLWCLLSSSCGDTLIHVRMMIETNCVLNMTGSFDCHLSPLALPFGLIWSNNTILSKACLFERRKRTLTASVFNCNRISPCTFYIETSKIHTEGGLVLKNVLQSEPRRLFCLQLLVFSQGIDFVLSYTRYYEWRGYLFTSPNQAWLGRTISAVMKSIFQARSTMVRSPAPQPLIKETFPPSWGVC